VGSNLQGGAHGPVKGVPTEPPFANRDKEEQRDMYMKTADIRNWFITLRYVIFVSPVLHIPPRSPLTGHMKTLAHCRRGYSSQHTAAKWTRCYRIRGSKSAESDPKVGVPPRTIPVSN